VQTKASDIKHLWHQIDVGGKTLGRVATGIATLLMGKSKPYFVKNMDCGDFVVVTNVSKIVATGNKLKQKIYTSYSGFPGGIRKEALGDLLQRKPTEVIRRAVYGMLPKNKLRDSMIKRLYLYKDAEHPYKDKLKKYD